MTEIEKTRNIGEFLGKRLRSVGIDSKEQLLVLGDDAAFGRLIARFPEDACTHTRLALAGAVRDVRWFGLSDEIKRSVTKGLSR